MEEFFKGYEFFVGSNWGYILIIRIKNVI